MQSRQPLTTSRNSLGSDRDTGKVGLTSLAFCCVAPSECECHVSSNDRVGRLF